MLLDPILAPMAPDKIWSFLGLDDAPFRITPLVVATSMALFFLVRRFAWDPVATYLFALFAAAQANGLRLGPIDVFDVVLLLGVLVSFAAVVGHQNQPLQLPPVVLAGFLMLGFALPHLIVEPPVRFLVGSIGLLRGVLISLLIVNLLADERRIEIALKALLVVGGISATIAIAQFFASYIFGVNVTLLDPPESAFKPTPIGMVMRASGLCITAQHLSGFLATALPFAMWRATHTWRWQDLALVGLIAVAIVLTWNFSAIIAMAALCAVFPMIRWPTHFIQLLLLYFLVALVVYLSGLGEWAWAHLILDPGTAKGTSQRATLNLLAIDKLDRSMWVGTGPQAFAEFSGNFWHRPVHNAYLQAMTELGLLGALTLIGLVLYLLAALARASCEGNSQNTLLRPALLALVVNAALMMSEPMYDHSNLWLFLGVFQALLLVHMGTISRRSDRSATLRRGLPEIRSR